MEKISKETRVLNYLKRYNNITPLEALKECGTMRLSAIIYNLRRKGWSITSERIDVPTRFGTACVSKYVFNGRIWK